MKFVLSYICGIVISGIIFDRATFTHGRGKIIFRDDGDNNNCLHVAGFSVKCIPVRECSYYFITSRGNSTERSKDTNLQLLKLHSCGFLRNEPLICCDMGHQDSRKIQKFADVSEDDLSRKPNNLLPQPEECLKYDYRIVGGQEAAIGEFPWMSMLLYVDKNFKIEFGCGGALISHRYVLTAAHCVKADDRIMKLIAVRLGEWNRMLDKDCDLEKCADPVRDVLIDEEIVHEDYTNDKLYHDIAILRLSIDVSYTTYVKPLCLPIDENIQKRNLSNDVMQIMGWGQWNDMNSFTSNVLQKGTVKAISSKLCSRIYKVRISDTQMCAGGNGTNPCKGDSGGPLVYGHIDEKLIQYNVVVGIVSRGPSECTTSEPAVYTRITSYVDWIISKMR